MESGTTRTTVYLDTPLHQALRLKAASTRRSLSDIVNEAVRAALREDEEDFAAFAERSQGKPLGYEQFLAQLKTEGTL